MPFKDSNGTCMLMPSVKRLPSVYTPCAAVEKKRHSGLRPIVKVYRACVRPILALKTVLLVKNSQFLQLVTLNVSVNLFPKVVLRFCAFLSIEKAF